MTAGGGYVTRKKRVSLCGAKNSAGFSSLVQTLLPRVKKLPIGLRVGSGLLNPITNPRYHLLHVMVQPALKTE
jgi:hypothetical protein